MPSVFTNASMDCRRTGGLLVFRIDPDPQFCGKSLKEFVPASSKSMRVMKAKLLILSALALLSLAVPAIAKKRVVETTSDGRPIVASTGKHWRNHYRERDRKSTRLNSSHVSISYAVFC